MIQNFNFALLENKIDNLTYNNSSLLTEQLQVFEVENELRILLEKNFPEKEKYLELYNQKIIFLIEKVKLALVARPFHFAVKAAANKGKAFYLGIKAFEKMRLKPDFLLKTTVKSNQEVFLLPQDKIVLKKSTLQSQEEEELIKDLFDLMSKQAVVATCTLPRMAVLKKLDKKHQTHSLGIAQVKHFVHDMTLMNDGFLSAVAREQIFARLTPEAEYNAILTAELQLLDLHEGNLGVAPEHTNDFRIFKHTTFFCKLKAVRGINFLQRKFIDLMKSHLADALDKSQPIKYFEKRKTIFKSLESFPELEKALEGPWKFVIFDMDFSLSEDNRLLKYEIKEKIYHIIPIKSFLFETEWKDKLLSSKTVDLLINSGQKDERVRHWIKKLDAPLYNHLSSDAKEKLTSFIIPFIKKYSLSQVRENCFEEITIKSLQNQFVEEIIQINDQTASIWHLLQRELKFKNSFDLISNSNESIEKRKKIARQLFPRLTWLQQQALIERQDNRKSYLEGYQALNLSHLQGENLKNQLKIFIQKKQNPLSFFRREELLTQLEQISLSTPFSLTNLRKLKDELLEECQPTYFNVVQAMYPLIADAYALSLAIHQKNKAKAGRDLGQTNGSLERLIDYAKQLGEEEAHTKKLAFHLENQIKSVENPKFFGRFC